MFADTRSRDVGIVFLTAGVLLLAAVNRALC